ncbi:hypothetical protein HMPREF2605_03180 [Rothia sp. HMSC065C03]|nr:hypothetical protein HMPREF2605_03180 [Rothia sp. HMSC065C03]
MRRETTRVGSTAQKQPGLAGVRGFAGRTRPEGSRGHEHKARFDSRHSPISEEEAAEALEKRQVAGAPKEQANAEEDKLLETEGGSRKAADKRQGTGF